MATFRPKRQSVNRAKKDLEAFARRKKKLVANALGMWMDDTVGQMQDELLAVGAYDQGFLAGATTRDPVKQTGPILSTKGHNDLEYASTAEFGRKAKQGKPPPLLPLVGWAGRKGIITHLPRNISFGGVWAKKWAASGAILRHMTGRKSPAKKQKPLDPEIRDLLTIRLIAKKIYEKGTVARRPFSRVFNRRKPNAAKEIADLVRLGS